MSTAPQPQRAVQDPVEVDSGHYKVELENERVRVLRIHYGANEKSVMHSHPDSVVIVQNDALCRFTFPDGKTEEHRFRAGETMYTPAGSHLPEKLRRWSSWRDSGGAQVVKDTPPETVEVTMRVVFDRFPGGV